MVRAFLRGMASVFDLFPTLHIDIPLDEESIRSDWEAVLEKDWDK